MIKHENVNTKGITKLQNKIVFQISVQMGMKTMKTNDEKTYLSPNLSTKYRNQNKITINSKKT